MKAEVTNWRLFWLSWMSVAYALASITFLFTWSQFQDLYRGFSVAPPALTQTIISSPRFVWWVLVVLGAIQLLAFVGLALKRTRSLQRAFVFVSVINLVLVTGMFVALYVPIFRLGSVV